MLGLNLFNTYGFYDNVLNGSELIVFASISFILLSVLIIYYNQIPKSDQPKSKLQNPIYQSKDILLQSNSEEVNFVIPDKITSPWVKAFVFALIAIVVFTPLYQLLGVEYFI